MRPKPIYGIGRDGRTRLTQDQMTRKTLHSAVSPRKLTVEQLRQWLINYQDCLGAGVSVGQAQRDKAAIYRAELDRRTR